MESILSELRLAARSLRRTPAITIAALITLAIGIGANSAVFRQGVGLAIVGIIAGFVGASFLTRLMTSLLFGVSPSDLVTLASVAALLGAVAAAASYLPALRATRVDPLVTLRDE